MAYDKSPSGEAAVAYSPLPDVETASAATAAGSDAQPGSPHARRPLTLLPLIALIFFEVSGGPFGTEVRAPAPGAAPTATHPRVPHRSAQITAAAAALQVPHNPTPFRLPQPCATQHAPTITLRTPWRQLARCWS